MVQILADAETNTPPGSGSAELVQFSFDGGTFNDPAELKYLTDAELRTVRVASPRVHVILNQDGAAAIGDRSVVDVVYNSWALQRGINRTIYPQAREYSAKSSHAYLRYTDSPSGSGFGCWVLILILTIGGYALLVQTGAFSSYVGLLVGALIWSGILIAIFPALTRTVAEWIRPVRVRVVPQTLAEYRDVRAADRIPRNAWIVSIIAMLAVRVAGTLLEHLTAVDDRDRRVQNRVRGCRRRSSEHVTPTIAEHGAGIRGFGAYFSGLALVPTTGFDG